MGQKNFEFVLINVDKKSSKLPAAQRESNFLILPSGRQLRKYKNEVPQKSGINDEILHWMYSAAKEQNLEENGYSGGLVHDETKIQEGLVLSMKGGYPNLIG